MVDASHDITIVVCDTIDDIRSTEPKTWTESVS